MLLESLRSFFSKVTFKNFTHLSCCNSVKKSFFIINFDIYNGILVGDFKKCGFHPKGPFRIKCHILSFESFHILLRFLLVFL